MEKKKQNRKGRKEERKQKETRKLDLKIIGNTGGRKTILEHGNCITKSTDAIL